MLALRIAWLDSVQVYTQGVHAPSPVLSVSVKPRCLVSRALFSTVTLYFLLTVKNSFVCVNNKMPTIQASEQQQEQVVLIIKDLNNQ